MTIGPKSTTRIATFITDRLRSAGSGPRPSHGSSGSPSVVFGGVHGLGEDDAGFGNELLGNLERHAARRHLVNVAHPLSLEEGGDPSASRRSRGPCASEGTANVAIVTSRDPEASNTVDRPVRKSTSCLGQSWPGPARAQASQTGQ